MIKKKQKTQTLSQWINEVHEILSNAHTDIVAKWNGDDIVLYSDRKGTNITLPDGEFYHFDTWDEFIKAKLFDGKAFETECAFIDLYL